MTSLRTMTCSVGSDSSAALRLGSGNYFVITLLLIFRSLCAVFGTGLLSVGYAGGIESTSDDMVSGTGKILNTAAADQHNAMLL